MPISATFVTRFLQLLVERRFTEAERVLERLRGRAGEGEWEVGYLRALEGMLLSWRSDDDRYAFLPGLNLTDRKELRRYREEFRRHAEGSLHADYDRGYFSAWAECMRVLERAKPRGERPAESGGASKTPS